MIRALVLAVLCAGCLTESPIDVPFLELGYRYECEVEIVCDEQTITEATSTCSERIDLATRTGELQDHCLKTLGVELGCAQWFCSAKCSEVSYCL